MWRGTPEARQSMGPESEVRVERKKEQQLAFTPASGVSLDYNIPSPSHSTELPRPGELSRHGTRAKGPLSQGLQWPTNASHPWRLGYDVSSFWTLKLLL